MNKTHNTEETVNNSKPAEPHTHHKQHLHQHILRPIEYFKAKSTGSYSIM